jgi:hypothetical protein
MNSFSIPSAASASTSPPSFVFALRAAGVPARVVAGYQGGEVNPVDGYLVVRQYDAHAWTEAWIAGRGWVRIDPTAISAPSRINSSLAAAVPAGEALPFLARSDLAWLRELRYRLDAVTNGWNQWVLGYNPQRQRDLLASLGLGEPDWRSMTAVLSVLCGMVHARTHRMDTAQSVARRSRALAPGAASPPRLARRGIVWREWEGPLAFADRAAAGDPFETGRTASVEIAALYAGLRYGPAPRADDLDRTSGTGSPPSGHEAPAPAVVADRCSAAACARKTMHSATMCSSSSPTCRPGTD